MMKKNFMPRLGLLKLYLNNIHFRAYLMNVKIVLK